jgi:hypothetical protein
MRNCPTCGAPKPNEDWDWTKSVSVMVDGGERIIRLTDQDAKHLYSMLSQSWRQDGKPKGDWRDGVMDLLFAQFGIDSRMVDAGLEASALEEEWKTP